MDESKIVRDSCIIYPEQAHQELQVSLQEYLNKKQRKVDMQKTLVEYIG